jgi:lysophospholipase L1-like esterase
VPVGALPPAAQTVAAPPTASPAPSVAESPTATFVPAVRAAGPLLARPIRYAALGASDTVGLGTSDPAHENWTARVAAGLPGDTVYQRFARSGITLYESENSQLGPAIAFKPTLVSVWLVVNDVMRGVPLPVYRQGLTAMLDRLTTETDARIVMLNVPDLANLLPANATPTTRAQFSGVARAWNAALADTVRPYGDRVVLVDLYQPSEEATQHLDWLSSDGFHPSASGYSQIAQQTLAALRKAGWLEGQNDGK